MKPHYSSAPALFVALFVFGLHLNHYAATRYVSNSGSNSNSGISWDQAWATLQWAEDHIAAGDTVWVANGTYTGFDVRTTGTAANPIVFIGAGNNVIINAPTGTTDGINVENADYVEINGFRVINMPRNGIRLVNADNCIVRNNYCESNFERGIFTGFTDDILIEYNECLTSDDEHGIYVSNSSDRSIIRYNVCHHNNRGGIQINADGSQGGDGISSNPEIYGNILYENGAVGGAAINLDGVQGAFIYNNLLYENHASGIALFQQDGNAPSINATIVHNTIVNDSNARWCVLIVNGATGAKVYNNILLNQHPWRGSIALDADAVNGFDSDYNILVNSLSRNGDGSSVTFATWQGYGYDEHSQLADSQYEIFMSPESGQDYHLAEGSQAIEAGSADFAFGVESDLEGNSRPQGSQHDIGTYESTLPLAIDEEEQYKDENLTAGILIGPHAITWPDGLQGMMSLLNAEGKLLIIQDANVAGSFNFGNLIPGIYVLVLSDANGVQWSQKVLISQ
jgi:parallel beta-helix repeat protein